MYSRVYVEITNICNMSCSFCHGHSRAPRRMTQGEFSRVLDCLDGRTKYIYYHLMGESLTHPSLPQFIDMSTKRGYKSMITTNGTLLSARKDELISSKPHKINISLHSFEGDSEEKHRKYLAEIADFSLSAADAGIIIVLRLWNNGFDDGKNDFVLNFLKENIPGEWRNHQMGLKACDKVYLEWGDRFDWPDIDADDGGDCVSCYGLRDHIGILCDGTVVPCCLDSDGVINLGNIFESDLSEILVSDHACAIKQGFEKRCATEELCRRCGYARRF